MSQLDRVRSIYTGETGLPGVTTMWFNPAEGLNPQDLVDRIASFWGALQGSLSSSLTVTVEPVVDSIDSTTGEITGSSGPTAPAPITGANAGQLLPLTTQALVQLRSGVFFTGRELRGRMFIPGWCESENDAGKPTAGLISLLGGAAQSLANDADQVVYSPTKRQFADVSTTQVWSQWAVLRSRRD